MGTSTAYPTRRSSNRAQWSDSSGTALFRPDGSRLFTEERAYAVAGATAGQVFGATTPSATIFRYNTLTGVTTTGETSETVTDEIDGISMVKLVSNTTATNMDATITTNIAAGVHGQYNFLVYLANPEAINSIVILLANAALTKWGLITIDVDHAGGNPVSRRKTGWYAISVTDENSGDNGGWSFAVDPVERVRFRVTPNSGQAATVYLHSVTHSARSAPVWILGNDDGFSTLTDKVSGIALGPVTGEFSVKDILDFYGFRGTVWLSAGPIDRANPDRTTWAALRELVAAGWGVGVQSYNDPQDTINSGSRLLGPLGYAARTVASVDSAANTLTTTAHRMPTNSARYSFPITFSGTDLPAPLVAGTIYWARRTTDDVFQVYATEAASFVGSAPIDLTTSGTAANFTWRYGNSANDHTAIQADLQACINACQKELGVTPRHYAPNQGAVDEYVAQAAANVGLQTIRGVTNWRYFNYLPPELNRPVIYGNVVQSDDTAKSQASIEAEVDVVCVDGGLGHSYHHILTSANAATLILLCNYLTEKRAAGHIQVLTIQEWERLYGV